MADLLFPYIVSLPRLHKKREARILQRPTLVAVSQACSNIAESDVRARNAFRLERTRRKIGQNLKHPYRFGQ